MLVVSKVIALSIAFELAGRLMKSDVEPVSLSTLKTLLLPLSTTNNLGTTSGVNAIPSRLPVTPFPVIVAVGSHLSGCWWHPVVGITTRLGGVTQLLAA